MSRLLPLSLLVALGAFPFTSARPEEPKAAADFTLTDPVGKVWTLHGQEAKAVVVATRSGFTARQVARHRPRVPVIAVTATEAVRRRLSLVWGVTAVTSSWLHDTDSMLERFGEPVLATGLVERGALVVVTAGWPFGAPGITNLVHVARV